MIKQEYHCLCSPQFAHNREQAIPVKGLIGVGGVAKKSPYMMQMMADVMDMPTVEGKLRPSSDTQTHAVLYKHWEDINGIVHTHSTYATAWAQLLRDIPIYGTRHADHNTVDIPCAAPMNDEMIQGNYEYETGFQIMNCFAERSWNYKEVEMILVGNHASFTWGKTADKAVYNSAVLEQVAQMAFITESIKADALRLKDTLIRKHYDHKHGTHPCYGQ